MTFVAPGATAFNASFASINIGTSNFVVASAYAGSATPEANGAVDSKVYRYYAQSADGSIWESGSGAYTYATHTLARTTIAVTSNGDQALVNFSSPPIVTVFPSPTPTLEPPPATVVRYDVAQSLSAPQQAQARTNIVAAQSGANSDLTSLSGLTTPLSAAQGGTGNAGGAWTTYTPLVGASSGSLGSASATGRYRTIGKIVHIHIDVTIVSNGTGAGAVQTQIPFDAASTCVLVAREDAITGALCQAVHGGSLLLNIFTASNGYPGANGAVFRISGSYESI